MLKKNNNNKTTKVTTNKMKNEIQKKRRQRRKRTRPLKYGTYSNDVVWKRIGNYLWWKFKWNRAQWVCLCISTCAKWANYIQFICVLLFFVFHFFFIETVAFSSFCCHCCCCLCYHRRMLVACYSIAIELIARSSDETMKKPKCSVCSSYIFFSRVWTRNTNILCGTTQQQQ